MKCKASSIRHSVTCVRFDRSGLVIRSLVRHCVRTTNNGSHRNEEVVEYCTSHNKLMHCVKKMEKGFNSIFGGYAHDSSCASRLLPCRYRPISDLASRPTLLCPRSAP